MLDKVNERIESLSNRDFTLGDLEDAKKIKFLIFQCKQKGCKDEELDRLSNRLRNVLKEKFKRVNPDFSDEIIEHMLSSYSFGLFYVPYEIEVINSLVFCRVHIYDDFGSIEKGKIYLLHSDFNHIDNSAEFEFDCKKNFIREEYEKVFNSKEIEMKVADFICRSINQICEKDVVSPLYKRNTDKIFYGYRAIETIGGASVLVDSNYDKICKAMYEERPIIMNLVLIENNESIVCFEIKQTMTCGLPNWEVINKFTDSWKMSRALKKKYN